ncbi:MAG: peptidoglycan-binding domain-containing protein [Pseudomonadota bacterium]
MFRLMVVAAFSSSLALIPAKPAQADLGEVLGGAVIGAVIGSAIRNNQGTTRQTTTTTTRNTCGVQCQQNREAQTALNYFGYNAGGVDGAWGPQSRRAATAYESEMGFFADGNLTDMERQFLISSYSRAQGGFVGPHQQALNTGGPRGLLRSFNDERLGRFQAPQTQQAVAPSTTVAPVPQTTVAPAETASPFVGFDVSPASRSMTSYCNETQQLSIAAGGTISSVNPQNAPQAMSEQFCLSRDYASRHGQQIISGLSGMTSADVENICSGLASSLAPIVADLSNQDRAVVLDRVRQTASDITQDRMVATGQICLSVGYDLDRGDIATAGALLAAAAGQPSYSEVVAHHLRGGFGVTASPDRARTWYNAALAEFDAGAPAAILPNQTAQRNAILRAANSPGMTASQQPVAVQPGQSSTLPTFDLGSD